MVRIVRVIRRIHITTKKPSSLMNPFPQNNIQLKAIKKISILEMMRRNNIMLIKLSRSQRIVDIMVIITTITIIKPQEIIIGNLIAREMENSL